MMNLQQIKSSIALVKQAPYITSKANLTRFVDFVRHGIVFLHDDGSVAIEVNADVGALAIKEFGFDTETFNNTFYETFGRVEAASDIELFFDQAMHYMSTYGAEQIGLKGYPAYIPIRITNPKKPELEGEMKLITIILRDEKDIVAELNMLFNKVQTLNSRVEKELLPPILDLLSTSLVDTARSFQVKCVLADKMNTTPHNPQEALRYILYKLTAKTTLIKDSETIYQIKEALSYQEPAIIDKIAAIIAEVGEARMASIFYRYKPLFLALKKAPALRPIINRIRRLAPKNHQPQPFECIQNIIEMYRRDYEWKDIDALLKKATNREIVKIVNKLLVLTQSFCAETSYIIRNGKNFVGENNEEHTLYTYNELLGHLLAELSKRLLPVLKDKVFYIPEYIDYAVPTSERQMIGAIPFGSSINFGGSVIVPGIHWTNTVRDGYEERIDVDLHLTGYNGSYGWNSFYRDNEKDANVIYSGDMTDAPLPNGASEAFYINTDKVDDIFTLDAFLYNTDPDKLNCQFYMTKEYDFKKLEESAMFNPNNLMFPPIRLMFNQQSMKFGLIADGVFYFYGGSNSGQNIPGRWVKASLESTVDKCKYRMSLVNLLRAFGAKILRTEEEAKTYENERVARLNMTNQIDNAKAAKRMIAMINKELPELVSLSPENLRLDTLLNIIDGVSI